MKEAGVSPPLFWELARDTQAIFSNWAIQHRMLKNIGIRPRFME